MSVTIIVILALSVGMTYTTAAPRDFSCIGVVGIPQVECEALVALYNSTSGASWTENTNWLVTSTPATWFGVTVSGGHITRLDQYNNHLSGTIPPQLGNLANLTYLALDSNQLTGSIPPELGSLSNLSDLWLKSNQLSGGIPPELGNLAHLTYLNLSSNQLTGNIPVELGSLEHLYWLALYSNQLSGSIPPQLGGLANLEGLALSVNQLSDSIPTELGNLSSLTYLNLSTNQLSGSIPTQLGSLGNLNYLWLKSNQLSGSIPPELASLVNLFYMSLSHNELSGSIPFQLGSMNLFELYLSHNHLSGSIPSQLAGMPNIGILTLSDNWLTVPKPYPSEPPTPLDTFLIGIAPGWETTQGLVASIPLSGGQVQSSDGRVMAAVPAGGVSQPITLVLTSLAAPSHSAGALFFAHTSFTLAAYDAQNVLISPFNFILPATVTLSYLDGDVTGQDESQLALYFWDALSSSWKDAAQTCTTPSSYQHDLLNNTLTGQVCHLTEFALMVRTVSQISGRITDGANGIQNVTVSTGNGVSATTDAAGNYTLSGLLPGTYTLTPSMSAYSFDPVSQQVSTASVDQAGIDFTGSVIAPPEYKIYLPSVLE